MKKLILLIFVCSVCYAGGTKSVQPIIDKNAYRLISTDPNCKIVLGNEDATSEFQAHSKFTFWGEDSFIFEQAGVKGTPTVDNGVVTLDSTVVKTEWFVDGNNTFKWIITLKQKPPTNTYSFRLGGNWQDFDFCYQTPFENPTKYIENGIEYYRVDHNEGPILCDIRPASVDGSYAVYHKSKKDNNYKTGKVLHIFRPKATDSNNTSVWVELSILAGKYSGTISQSFLDKAVYPVIINDTFGYTSVGGTQSDLATNNVSAFGPFSPSSSGSVTSVSVYLYTSSEFDFTVGIYDESGNEPSSLLKDSGGKVFTGGPTWATDTLDSALSVTQGVNYWFADNNNRTNTCAHKWDEVAGKHVHQDSQTYDDGNLLATFVSEGTAASRSYSAYATYTPSAATAGQVIMITTY